MTKPGERLTYRPTFGLIVIHYEFRTPAARERARTINAMMGAAYLVTALAVYVLRGAIFDAVTLAQALALLALGWLTAAWLVEAVIVVLCRPKRIFVRWPKPQPVSKTLKETWGDDEGASSRER